MKRARSAAAAGAWLLVAGLVCALPRPLPAHHSFAMFDREREAQVTGTVKALQWTNPHAWLQVQVTEADGQAHEYSFEGGSPGILSRNGWNRNVVRPGERVTVVYYPLKDGSRGGSFVEVHTSDGKTYYYHG